MKMQKRWETMRVAIADSNARPTRETRVGEIEDGEEDGVVDEVHAVGDSSEVLGYGGVEAESEAGVLHEDDDGGRAEHGEEVAGGDAGREEHGVAVEREAEHEEYPEGDSGDACDYVGEGYALAGQGCADDEEDGEVEELCEVGCGDARSGELTVDEEPLDCAKGEAEEKPRVAAGTKE